jgi:hypothetical protein
VVPKRSEQRSLGSGQKRIPGKAKARQNPSLNLFHGKFEEQSSQSIVEGITIFLLA